MIPKKLLPLVITFFFISSILSAQCEFEDYQYFEADSNFVYLLKEQKWVCTGRVKLKFPYYRIYEVNTSSVTNFNELFIENDRKWLMMPSYGIMSVEYDLGPESIRYLFLKTLNCGLIVKVYRPRKPFKQKKPYAKWKKVDTLIFEPSSD